MASLNLSTETKGPVEVRTGAQSMCLLGLETRAGSESLTVIPSDTEVGAASRKETERGGLATKPRDEKGSPESQNKLEGCYNTNFISISALGL